MGIKINGENTDSWHVVHIVKGLATEYENVVSKLNESESENKRQEDIIEKLRQTINNMAEELQNKDKTITVLQEEIKNLSRY